MTIAYIDNIKFLWTEIKSAIGHGGGKEQQVV